jgi:hypothetical protein
VSHIIGPELAASDVDLATKLRLVAAVGLLEATAILDAGSRAPISTGEQLFRRKVDLHLRFDRAMAQNVGPILEMVTEKYHRPVPTYKGCKESLNEHTVRL